MTVQRKQIGTNGMFYVENDGAPQAEMTFHMTTPELMVIEHTEVDEELQGHGVGLQLVHAAVDYAREHNIKIKVLCPFAKKVFERKPEWNDVLNK